ncbi:MAG: type II secretion system protein [Actinomycetes bacterium]
MKEHDRGSSLIEVVIAVALMGIVVSGVLGAMWSAIRMSSFSDDQAKVEAVLGSAADRLANYAYIPCPTNNSNGGYLPIIQAASGTVDWPTSSVTLTQMYFWNPSSTSTGTWLTTNGLSGTECNETASLTTARTLQRITFMVTSPSGYSKTLEVVKSNVFPRSIS